MVKYGRLFRVTRSKFFIDLELVKNGGNNDDRFKFSGRRERDLVTSSEG